MEIEKHDKLPEMRACEVKYCRYERKYKINEMYLFVRMTRDEYEHLGFHREIFKHLNEWNYHYNTFWVKVCPKHFNEILRKHKNYIMWCSV